MTHLQLAYAVIGSYEGENLEAHKVDGKWHIGKGHNLDIDQTPEELDAMGCPNGLPHYLEGFTITKEQSDKLFEIDIEDAIDDLAPAFSPDEINALDDARAVVLISMAFQLGGRGVRKFKNFIAAVKSEDWERASAEMLYADPATERPSAWYKQTQQRCVESAKAMRDGFWVEFQGSPQNKGWNAGTPPDTLEAKILDLQQQVNALTVKVDVLQKKRKFEG